MAKTPKKVSKPKSAKPKVSTPKTVAPKKPAFDKEAFVFETPIEEIENALERFEAQEADDMAEPLTADQHYWWGIWLMQLPDAKRRGMTHVPTCAIENAVLKIPRKPKAGGKK